MKALSLFIAFSVVLLAAVRAHAGTGGSVSGTVKDRSGAVIAHATVSVINVETGVKKQVETNGSGFYSLPELPVGRYNIAISRTSFKTYQRTAIAIDTNSELTVDAVLDVGESFDAVTVIDTAVHAETSSSQIGELISSAKMAAVPLNGRSYTDLLALQPGVAPVTSLTANTQQDVGVSALSPSGGLNPGTISINGQREFANAFTVNGSDVEEDVNSGTAIIPNLDSVAEFRVLTSNFDAEYGGYSG
ncbi:MAG: carboxypeptidase-like regulatory domain-containing protein, partial [Terriglobales bacterium]